MNQKQFTTIAVFVLLQSCCQGDLLRSYKDFSDENRELENMIKPRPDELGSDTRYNSVERRLEIPRDQITESGLDRTLNELSKDADKESERREQHGRNEVSLSRSRGMTSRDQIVDVTDYQNNDDRFYKIYNGMRKSMYDFQRLRDEETEKKLDDLICKLEQSFKPFYEKIYFDKVNSFKKVYDGKTVHVIMEEQRCFVSCLKKKKFQKECPSAPSTAAGSLVDFANTQGKILKDIREELVRSDDKNLTYLTCPVPFRREKPYEMPILGKKMIYETVFNNLRQIINDATKKGDKDNGDGR